MRGKVLQFRQFPHLSGITPAYAGKRFTNPSVVMIIKDHPRLCGEKRTPHEFVRHKIGSPPPMRGKVFVVENLFVFYRITPAYAGKSGGAAGILKIKQDHPRLCGEKV